MEGRRGPSNDRTERDHPIYIRDTRRSNEKKLPQDEALLTSNRKSLTLEARPLSNRALNVARDLCPSK